MGSARIGQDAFGPTLQARYAPGFVSQGVAAELIAQRWGVSRDEMDALSVESHRRAAATRAAGDFAAEIVPVPTGTGEFREDETIRPGTTHEALAQLKLAFRSDEMCARFPAIQWGVTAGNASPTTHGPASLRPRQEHSS